MTSLAKGLANGTIPGESVSQGMFLDAVFCYLASLTMWLLCVYFLSSQPCFQLHRMQHTGLGYCPSSLPDPMFIRSFACSVPCLDALSFLIIPLAVPFKEPRCGVRSVQITFIKREYHGWFSGNILRYPGMMTG